MGCAPSNSVNPTSEPLPPSVEVTSKQDRPVKSPLVKPRSVKGAEFSSTSFAEGRSRRAYKGTYRHHGTWCKAGDA